MRSTSQFIYSRSIIELLIASVIWGASFTCVRWALEDFSVTTLIFFRFLIAFVFGEFFYFAFNRQNLKNSNSDIFLSAKAGFFLGSSLILQTYGLHYTTATNSSFITSMYVVLVPFVAFAFFKQTVQLHHVVLANLAFVGMALLLKLHSLSHLNIGDALTLVCALASSFHLIYVGYSAPQAKSAFRFNNYQNFWSLFLVLPFVFYENRFHSVAFWPESVHLKSFFSLLTLALLASLLAFYLQVRAQKNLNTTTSSLLCLLEAPNAFLFAALFLNETLEFWQVVGVVIILLSSGLSVYMDRPQNR